MATKPSVWSSLFASESEARRHLPPRLRFLRHLAVNVALGLGLILVSLLIGMICYRRLEGLDWVRAFSHAAMILGGMGPYEEPKSDGGQIFEGLYALYSGLILIFVSSLILAPVFHRVLHQFNLPDEEDPDPKPKPKPRSSSAKRGSA